MAKRIEELQARNERKAEMAALSRDELIEILTDIVHAALSRLSEARRADDLKAAEMLPKMCGWNEPEEVNHGHIHLQVDAQVMEQLREGYARPGNRERTHHHHPYPWRARLECPRGHKRNRTKRAQSEFRLARDYHVILNPELQAFLVNAGLRNGSRPSLAMSQRLDELRGTPMEKIISELETGLQRYPPIKPGTPDPYVSPK